MASQGSDKLKAILAQAQEKARAAQASQAAALVAETTRVEALLDRNEALPDPRALSRLYRSRDLAERLPDDEDSAMPAALTAETPAASAPPAALAAVADPGLTRAAMQVDAALPTAAAAAPGADTAPARPPLSPAQIREVMNELKEQFTSNTYVTYEAKPNPVDVIPMPEEEEVVVVTVEEPNERFYIVGALIAMAVIGVFVILALSGPLRYRPPAGGPVPGPSASARP